MSEITITLAHDLMSNRETLIFSDGVQNIYINGEKNTKAVAPFPTMMLTKDNCIEFCAMVLEYLKRKDNQDGSNN